MRDENSLKAISHRRTSVAKDELVRNRGQGLERDRRQRVNGLKSGFFLGQRACPHSCGRSPQRVCSPRRGCSKGAERASVRLEMGEPQARPSWVRRSARWGLAPFFRTHSIVPTIETERIAPTRWSLGAVQSNRQGHGLHGRLTRAPASKNVSLSRGNVTHESASNIR